MAAHHPRPKRHVHADTHPDTSNAVATTSSRDAYDRLAAAAGAPVCARREWLDVWAAANPGWDTFTVEVPGPDAAVTAAAAVLARRRSWWGTRVVLAGAGDSDVACLPAGDYVSAGRLADEIVATLADVRGPWRLHFDQVPADSPLPQLLSRRLRAAVVGDGDPVPFTAFGDDRTPAGYLSRRFRKETRRRRRRLEEAHTVDVELVSDPAAIAAAADEVAALRRERDHDLGRPSTLDTDAGAAFWRGIVERFGARGDLELALLRADGRLAAYVISVVDGAAYRGWDGRIATTLAKFAPGQILDVAVFEHALARPELSLIDYGRGDQQQKMHYANDTLKTVQLRAWSSPLLRRWDRLVEATISRLRRFKEAHPGLERRWRDIKVRTLRTRG